MATIDNRKATPAPVDIEGKVDRYAPVTIKGSLNPFDPMASLDITTSFKRVELTNLTPYSGKFAGFRIRKGRLNLDLHYLITKGQLKAQNKVLIEQLQLGERVDSPDALDLLSGWPWHCSKTRRGGSPLSCLSKATLTTRSSV